MLKIIFRSKNRLKWHEFARVLNCSVSHKGYCKENFSSVLSLMHPFQSSSPTIPTPTPTPLLKIRFFLIGFPDGIISKSILFPYFSLIAFLFHNYVNCIFLNGLIRENNTLLLPTHIPVIFCQFFFQEQSQNWVLPGNVMSFQNPGQSRVNGSI